MVKVKRLFVDGTYGQMHVRITEPAEISKCPLVCLHMFPQSGRNFEYFLKAVGPDRVVIAPDFPGYGESDPPTSPITAEQYASSIWEVVDALSLTDQFGTVDIFGIHAGAKLAVEICYQRPDKVNSMALASAAVLSDQEISGLRKAFQPIPLDDEGTRFSKLWAMLNKNRGQKMTYEMMATSLAEMLRAGEHIEWGHYAVFDYNRKFPERLATLPHFIGIINPGDDLYEMTPRTMPYLKNGQLFDKAEWGHGFLEADAEELAGLVETILSREPQDNSLQRLAAQA